MLEFIRKVLKLFLKIFDKFLLLLPNRAPQETRMKNFKIPNMQDRTKGSNFDLNIGLKTLTYSP